MAGETPVGTKRLKSEIILELSANSDVPYFETLAEAIQQVAVGRYFKTNSTDGAGPHPNALWFYKRTLTSPFYQAMMSSAVPVTKDMLDQSLDEDLDAAKVNYGPNESGRRLRKLGEKFTRESVSVLDFLNDNGTIPGSGGDDSSAMNKALGTGRRVRIPNGIRIKCNIVTPPSFWIEGDTTKLSMIEPFDKTKPAVKVAWDNLYWSYCRVIQNIMFINAEPGSPAYAAKQGVGVAMGRNGPDDFTDVGPYPMYSGGMVFRNVVFRDLHIGFRSGCGNIGVEFFTCNAASCYYGFYFQDNKNLASSGNLTKPGGDTSYGDGMHAGNKYFYGGELDECDVAVYIHNVTEGFGAIVFYGTIIEYNKIGVYLYSNNVFFPIAFYDCWNEANGQAAHQTPRPGNVIVDAWATDTGSLVRSDKPLLPRTLIVEGTRVAVNYVGGFFTDVRMTATNSRITVTDSQVESQLGYGGSGHYVDDVSSKITLVRPKTLGGVGAFPNVFVEGAPHTEFAGGPYDPTIGYNPSQAGCRHFHVAPRSNKQFGGGQYATGAQEALSIAYTRPRALTGFQAYTPQIVSSGRIFPMASAFDFTTTSAAQYLLDNNAAFTTGTAGWYIVTYDIRRVDGLDVAVFIGDLSTTQILSAVPTIGTEWMTIAALAYLPAGRTFYPAFQPVSPGRTAFHFSAYQVQRFNTRLEAENYISSGTYVVESDDMYMNAETSLTWKSGGVIPWRFGPDPYAGVFRWTGDRLTAKKALLSGFDICFDYDGDGANAELGNWGVRWRWGGGGSEYAMKADAYAGALRLFSTGATAGVLNSEVHFNLVGKELRINGQKILGTRAAAIPDAVHAAADTVTKAEYDALVDKLNAVLAALRPTGHALIEA